MPQSITLPPALEPLRQLAYNLKWSWTPSTQSLFAKIDPDTWRESRHNPIHVLRNASTTRLNQLAQDDNYLTLVQREQQALNDYLAAGGAAALQGDGGATLLRKVESLRQDGPVAYFSAEFGLHESLPIYAGGLGVLAGDHTKSASDLNIPFVGVGLMYRSGYFEQRLSATGEQFADYPQRDFRDLPVEPVLDSEGQPLVLDLPLPGRKLFFRIWKASVGRSTLLLLDTQLNTNQESDRDLTAHLYGGDTTTRICQEMLLGVGGVRALQALSFQPSVYHLNEGHAAFVSIERVRQFLEAAPSLSLKDALQHVTQSQVFTTHTPVPAGHDRFMTDMVRPYFEVLLPEAQHPHIPSLLELGLEYSEHINSLFCMTVLALRTARDTNGVSKIHGDVSRQMWHHLWPSRPVEEVPIGHITNGIHATTWTSPAFVRLFQEHLAPDWERHLTDPGFWNQVDDIPAEALWQARNASKQAFLAFARYRLRLQRSLRNEPEAALAATAHLLDPNALTIGFARRFAPYKRATLLFSDPERLKAILHHPDHPVQIVFAGKSHPHNKEGQALIQTLYNYSHHPDFADKVFLLENYDMAVGRSMVTGVDLWLNNPTPPQEASGTSGQKVGFNGGLNCSILDGWWPEGYNKTNGWAIGEGKVLEQRNEQDKHDVDSLYQLLEEQIVPMYYERDANGIPTRWIAAMREAIRTLLAPFNTHRMVYDYLNEIYVPSQD